MSQGSNGSKPFSISSLNPNCLNQNTINHSKSQNNNQNALNQRKIENLQQNIEDMKARINMLNVQKEIEENEKTINLHYKDQEIKIYKEMINEAQQQYNDNQQQNDQQIKQLNSQIKDTQDQGKLTEQEIGSINEQIWVCQQNKTHEPTIEKIPFYFDYQYYKGYEQVIDQSRYHHDCSRMQNTIQIGDDGNIYCDGGCAVINHHIYCMNYKEKKIMKFEEKVPSSSFPLHVIFKDVLSQSLQKYDHQTKIKFRNVNI